MFKHPRSEGLLHKRLYFPYGMWGFCPKSFFFKMPYHALVVILSQTDDSAASWEEASCARNVHNEMSLWSCSVVSWCFWNLWWLVCNSEIIIKVQLILKDNSFGFSVTQLLWANGFLSSCKILIFSVYGCIIYWDFNSVFFWYRLSQLLSFSVLSVLVSEFLRVEFLSIVSATELLSIEFLGFWVPKELSF